MNWAGCGRFSITIRRFDIKIIVEELFIVIVLTMDDVILQ